MEYDTLSADEATFIIINIVIANTAPARTNTLSYTYTYAHDERKISPNNYSWSKRD